MSEGGDGAAAPAGWIRGALEDAFRALTEGRPTEAGALCRRVLAAAPELAEAHFLVGLIALELDDRRTAIAAFGTVTRLRPAHGAAWAQLAWLHARAGRTAAADRALAEAVRHPGASPAVADLIGRTCTLQGRHAEARDWFIRAVQAAPDRIDYRMNLANAEVVLGDDAAAAAALRAVLERVPDHAQAHWLLSGLAPARDRRHASELEALAARPGLTDRQLALYCYALGKELEDLGEWAAAFAAFSRGAHHRRTVVVFDEAAEDALFATLERVYDARWLASRAPGDPDPAPIFVIGQPRTGTTLVERILAAHSQVHAAGESQQFGLAVRRLVGADDTPQSAALPEGAPSAAARRPAARRPAARYERAALLDPAALGRAYLEGVGAQRGDRTRFVDKLPGNFLHVPLILAALPNARIVHLVREPMDACFASFKQLFADGYPHSYDQGEQARHYVRYHRLMAHWRREFPGRFLDVSYEALVSDLDRQARRLLDYLGLPWEDACLAFHTLAAPVATASAVQVREPAHTRSIARWRRYAGALEPMRAILVEAGVPVSDVAMAPTL